ncbi:MAG: acyloxyacyl hydrolase [Bacteroidia bacterium]|jgi:hypothetical protein
MGKLFSTPSVLLYAIVLLMGLLGGAKFASAQRIKGYGFNYHAGQVWAHNKFVQNTAHAEVTMIQLEFDTHLGDTDTWIKSKHYPHQGWMINYTNFGVPVLGHAINFAYYIQPTIGLGRYAELGLRATAGISIASNPYDASTNPANFSYSLPVTPHLVIGVHTGIHLSSHLTLTNSIQLNHISNASLSKPNSGANWPTLSAGLRYRTNPQLPKPLHDLKRPKDQKKLRADFTLFYARSMYSLTNRTLYSISGIQVQGSYFGRLHGWTLGFEMAKDQVYNQLISNNAIPIEKPVLISLMAGHEFIMGDFIFTQHFGKYVYQQGNYYPSMYYHRWGFMYYPIRYFGIGLNLKVHIEQANCIDLRLNYALNH